MYLLDEFVATKPGQAFRLFPFGRVVKGGKEHNITPEMARLFRLPHFKPPIKLGNHGSATAAGGHIVGLEVREDGERPGLYALPEYTDQGTAALERGDYRYHSPEVVWEGDNLEDPTSGAAIEGPLIIGDALLHTPHLGEAAALYSVEVVSQEDFMSDTVTVPLSFWDKMTAKLFPEKPEPVIAPVLPEPEPTGPTAEDFEALQVEADKVSVLEAEIEQMKADAGQEERLAHFSAELSGTTLAEAEDAPEMLASMTKEQSAWTVTQIKALSEQVNKSALFGEKGGSGSEVDGFEGNPAGRVEAAIRERMSEKNCDYFAALGELQKETPDLFTV